MHASLRALIEPANIESLTNATCMVLTASAFGYLVFVVLMSQF